MRRPSIGAETNPFSGWKIQKQKHWKVRRNQIIWNFWFWRLHINIFFLGINISPPKVVEGMRFPFPKVGYVPFYECNPLFSCQFTWSVHEAEDILSLSTGLNRFKQVKSEAAYHQRLNVNPFFSPRIPSKEITGFYVWKKLLVMAEVGQEWELFFERKIVKHASTTGTPNPMLQQRIDLGLGNANMLQQICWWDFNLLKTHNNEFL